MDVWTRARWADERKFGEGRHKHLHTLAAENPWRTDSFAFTAFFRFFNPFCLSSKVCFYAYSDFSPLSSASVHRRM